MHPIIEDHLSLTEPPEMFSLYSRAFYLFDAFGLEGLHSQYEDLMVSADGAGDGISQASNQSIYSLTIEILDQMLTQHQIAVNESATFANRIEVLEFIKQLDVTEFIAECREALRHDEFDNTDKFIRCMSIVQGMEEEDIALFIEPIEDCVIRVLKDFIERRCEFEIAVEPLDEDVKRVYKSLDRFSRAVKGSEMLCHKYVFDEEGVVGLPFAHYFKMNQEYLMGLRPEDMVLELIGWCIVSCDGFNDPTKTAMSEVSKYITDLNTTTRIHMLFEQTLIQYRNEIVSGVSRIE